MPGWWQTERGRFRQGITRYTHQPTWWTKTTDSVLSAQLLASENSQLEATDIVSAADDNDNEIYGNIDGLDRYQGFAFVKEDDEAGEDTGLLFGAKRSQACKQNSVCCYTSLLFIITGLLIGSSVVVKLLFLRSSSSSSSSSSSAWALSGPESINGGGWTVVRCVSSTEGTWHPATDNLRGTESYGTEQSWDADATWVSQFTTIHDLGFVSIYLLPKNEYYMMLYDSCACTVHHMVICHQRRRRR